MDSERFGRALGFGARAAAKTLLTAADAAASPNPSKSRQASGSQTATATPPTPTRASAAPKPDRVMEQVARTATQVFQTGQQVNQQKRQLQNSVMAPVKRLSGVLWLEFTGVFFGLFAVSALSAAWKLRDALHETPANHDAHLKLLVALGIALLFAYFCISSFLRAKKRERAR